MENIWFTASDECLNKILKSHPHKVVDMIRYQLKNINLGATNSIGDGKA